MKKGAKLALFGGAAGLFAAAGAWTLLAYEARPMPPGPPVYFRYSSPVRLDEALNDLAARKIIRSADAVRWKLMLTRRAKEPLVGTFEAAPGMSADEVMAALRRPIRRMIRVPEGWWISRVAARLDREDVAPKDEYISLAQQPEKFQHLVSIPLPKGSLEGFLYPDTYDFPPLLGAQDAIAMQLKTFEKRVVQEVKDPAKIRRALVVGSLIELEAGLDKERPIIAGVIENRLKKGMKLELDATVLFAMGRWINLGPGVVKTVKSPYNTYLNKGLPPGPIGSPSLKSIEAALHPASHEWLYYVARPTRGHYFAKTYQEHIANIKKARAEWKKHRQELAKKAAAGVP